MDISQEVRRQITAIESMAAEVVPRAELEQKLASSLREGRPLRVKYGIDPTNPRIHIGHLVPCRLLRLMQDLGHTAVLIVGDYTARIGDPTGRDAERPALSSSQVEQNARQYAEQLFTVVDRERAELHYQSSWFGSRALDSTLRLMASFSVAQMMSHETFRSRVDAGARLSLHELMYPVLQAYDSTEISADVEIGGTDQRFNCLCGRDLQRQRGETPQVVVTVPLLRGPDGTKMSKSRDNHISLGTPAPDVVGRIMSIPDELIEEYARLATTWPLQHKRSAIAALASGETHPRAAKLAVARNVAAFLCGPSEADAAVEEFDRVFSRKGHPESIPEHTLTQRAPLVVQVLVEAEMARSTSEARRLIQQGGVRMDGRRVVDIDERIELGSSASAVLRAGKRRFVRLRPSE